MHSSRLELHTALIYKSLFSELFYVSSLISISIIFRLQRMHKAIGSCNQRSKCTSASATEFRQPSRLYSGRHQRSGFETAREYPLDSD